MKKKQKNNNIPKGIGFFENLKTERASNFEEYIANRERKARQEERQFFERKKAEENVIWSAEQQKLASQIKTIQEELEKLIKETKGLSNEVKTAAVQAIVEPGIYHISFLEKLRNFIKFLRKQIQESKTWLSEWNSYCKKKRNYYWRQVKKSGTKFMLSSERYMSTQAG